MPELHFRDYPVTQMGLQMEMLLHGCLHVRLWAPSRQQPDTVHKLCLLMEALPFTKMSIFVKCSVDAIVKWWKVSETFLSEQRKTISTTVNHPIKKTDMPYSIQENVSGDCKKQSFAQSSACNIISSSRKHLLHQSQKQECFLHELQISWSRGNSSRDESDVLESFIQIIQIQSVYRGQMPVHNSDLIRLEHQG